MSVGTELFETVDPATGEVITERSRGFAGRRRRGRRPRARGVCSPAGLGARCCPPSAPDSCGRIGDLIEEHADELAELETRDQGQPIGIAREVSVAAAAEHFRYYAGWVTKIAGETNPLSFPGTFNYTVREPVGVCGLIIPWNFPLMISAWKLAPALACGEHVRGQAGRADAAHRPAPGGADRRGRSAGGRRQRRDGRPRRSAPPSPSTPASTRCRSRGRPRWDARSCVPPPGTSSASRSSSAARTLPSSSTTRRWTRQWAACCRAGCSTADRCAPRTAAYTSSARWPTSSRSRRPPRRPRCSSAPAWIPRRS